ncbi:MAG: tetratricopeptide repeat protein [Terrimicrobiaceae bacterium]
MKSPLKYLLPLLASLVLSVPMVKAQSPGAAEANNAAYTLFSAGNYAEAAKAYEQLLKDYPTDLVVGIGQIQLAFSYYFLGRFDEAQAILAKATSGPPLPPELQQVADGLLPQILSAKASAMAAADAQRKTTFEQAIAKFTEFISKYPAAPDLESVIYSRAIANYQIEKYEDVVKDAELNIQKFPESPTLPQTKNLLAIALATQGSLELGKGGDKAKAFTFYQRAADLLREIIKNRRDIALYNEANFQLAEILFNQAGFSEEAERPPLFQEALAAYRAIAPKEEIVALQQDRVAAFPDRRREALQQRNQALLKQLERENLRELTKLEELKNKPDQVASALLKMGEIFYQQGNINAARTLLRHVTPHLKSDEEKKRELYFRTMTYGLQGNSDFALAGYNEFQSNFKGDPLADNLPVTMGTMLLGQNKPEDAIRYFDESLTVYPDGRFTGLSVVSKAAAEARLGQYDGAAKTFQDFLAKNPPPEVGVIAQAGLANIYKDTSKWDEAIAAYKLVREKYPETSQAVEAEYWIGIATQQKGENAAAIPLLEAFSKTHPEHPLAALALYAKGGAQLATNDKPGGIASLAEVAAKYPDSQPAPYTYFMRAQLSGQEGDSNQVITLMREFIEKYPKDDKVFFAFDSVAQTLLATGKPEEALAAYRDFAQNYEESPQAADALQKAADLQRAAGEGLGRYGALNEAERAKWKTNVEASIATSEELLQKYPDSPSVALALRTLLQTQRLLAGAELKSPADIETYFQGLAESAASPQAKSKVLFALADYVEESDSGKALEIRMTAFDPQVVYAPADLDAYGTQLLAQKKTEEALVLFQKLEADYPIPAGTSPTQATPLIQEAQAIALFGRGRLAQEAGQTAEAGKLFEQLKSLYPWSPKVLEANFGIAQSNKESGQLDEAITLLTAIIRAPNATAELRANSMLLFGAIMLEKRKLTTDPKQKEEFLGGAIDNYIKIAQFYGGVPKAAAEGLWVGAQLIEEQANASTDSRFKSQQLNRAKTFYQQLATEYPNSEFAPKAKERLTALGT